MTQGMIDKLWKPSNTGLVADAEAGVELESLLLLILLMWTLLPDTAYRFQDITIIYTYNATNHSITSILFNTIADCKSPAD
jgi:hypothetical protein